MSERPCLLQSERTLQLIERSPALLRVERDLVRTWRRRSAVLDSIRKKVGTNLDVAVPRRFDSVRHPDVAPNIGVDCDALLLCEDRPGLRQVGPHESADEESAERLSEPSLALRGPLPNESFDAR